MNSRFSDDVIIGRLIKPFGISGYLKFLSYSGEIDHLPNIRHIRVGKSNRMYEVENWLLNSPTRCKIHTVDSPEQATEFSGLEIKVARTFACKLQEEEYYYTDLYNIQVIVEGQIRGTIISISDVGVAPLFEIHWDTNKISHIPFIKQFFDLPNLKTRTITLIKPELLE